MTNSFDGATPFTPDATDEPATPLVDEALAARRSRAADQADLEALRAEVSRLKDSLGETTSETGRIASERVQAKVNESPLVVAACIGLLAFVYGATR